MTGWHEASSCCCRPHTGRAPRGRHPAGHRTGAATATPHIHTPVPWLRAAAAALPPGWLPASCGGSAPVLHLAAPAAQPGSGGHSNVRLWGGEGTHILTPTQPTRQHFRRTCSAADTSCSPAMPDSSCAARSFSRAPSWDRTAARRACSSVFQRVCGCARMVVACASVAQLGVCCGGGGVGWGGGGSAHVAAACAEQHPPPRHVIRTHLPVTA